MSATTPTRSTKTKKMVRFILQKHEAPLTLAEITHLVQAELPKTAYSTVFRIVEALEAEGLVTRIDWRERGSRYEWADRPHHHHIVCTECGVVKDLDHTLFHFNEGEITECTGFSISHHSIEFEGTCSECQKEK